MAIIRRDFECERDFELVDRFLSDTYILNQKVYNWDNARWSFNRFCIHNSEEATGNRLWEKSVQIWEDDGVIVGVCHQEEPGDYFLQIHPEYKELEEEMLMWAMKNCKDLYPNIESINVSAHFDDEKRKSLMLKYNGIKHEFVDDFRKLTIGKKFELPSLPEGYRVINIDTSNREMCEKIARLYTTIWPSSVYMPNSETVMSFINSPAFNSELSFVIVNKNGDYVAFYVLWSDSYNKHAHLYPFGIDPKYGDSMIPKVVLGVGINTLYDQGFESLTLSAWYSEAEEAVFESFGFEKTGYGETYNLKL